MSKLLFLGDLLQSLQIQRNPNGLWCLQSFESLQLLIQVFARLAYDKQAYQKRNRIHLLSLTIYVYLFFHHLELWVETPRLDPLHFLRSLQHGLIKDMSTLIHVPYSQFVSFLTIWDFGSRVLLDINKISRVSAFSKNILSDVWLS